MRPSANSQTCSMRMRHAAAVAGDAEEVAVDGPGPLVLGDAEVLAVVGARRGHRLRVDLAVELLVEPAGGVATLQGAVRCADDVVLDVIGVHGDGRVGVAARALRRGAAR